MILLLQEMKMSKLGVNSLWMKSKWEKRGRFIVLQCVWLPDKSLLSHCHTMVSLEFRLRECRPSNDCWLEGKLIDFGITRITLWLVRRHSLYNLQWYLNDTWNKMKKKKKCQLLMKTRPSVILQKNQKKKTIFKRKFKKSTDGE